MELTLQGLQWEKPASSLASPAGNPLPALLRLSVGGQLILAPFCSSWSQELRWPAACCPLQHFQF